MRSQTRHETWFHRPAAGARRLLCSESLQRTAPACTACNILHMRNIHPHTPAMPQAAASLGAVQQRLSEGQGRLHALKGQGRQGRQRSVGATCINTRPLGQCLHRTSQGQLRGRQAAIAACTPQQNHTHTHTPALRLAHKKHTHTPSRHTHTHSSCLQPQQAASHYASFGALLARPQCGGGFTPSCVRCGQHP